MAELSGDAALLLMVLRLAGYETMAESLEGTIVETPSEREFDLAVVDVPDLFATAEGQVEAIVMAIEHQLFLPFQLLAESQNVLKNIVGSDVEIDGAVFSERLSSATSVGESARAAQATRVSFRRALGLQVTGMDGDE